MAEDFPQMLKALRAAKGISQRQLAEAISVHPSYISKLEKGQEKPTRELVETLARELDADPVQVVLAAGHLPREFAAVIAEHDELQRLLDLASRGGLPEQFYAKLAELLDREDKVTVPVWLE